MSPAAILLSSSLLSAAKSRSITGRRTSPEFIGTNRCWKTKIVFQLVLNRKLEKVYAEWEYDELGSFIDTNCGAVFFFPVSA